MGAFSIFTGQTKLFIHHTARCHLPGAQYFELMLSSRTVSPLRGCARKHAIARVNAGMVPTPVEDFKHHQVARLQLGSGNRLASAHLLLRGTGHFDAMLAICPAHQPGTVKPAAGVVAPCTVRHTNVGQGCFGYGLTAGRTFTHRCSGGRRVYFNPRQRALDTRKEPEQNAL